LSENSKTQIVSLKNVGDFPGSVRKSITVIIGDNRAVLYDYTEGQLKLCDGECHDDIYCIDNSDITKILTGSTCAPITGDASGNKILYFDSNDKSVTDVTKAKKAYKCEFKSGQASPYDLDKCTVVDEESIIIEDKGIMNCNVIYGCDKIMAPTQETSVIYDRMTTNGCLTPDTTCKTEHEDSTSGYLYTCVYESVSQTVKCSLINDVGYYIDHNDLYKCTLNIGSNDIQCIKSTKASDLDETSICDGNHYGDVVYNKNKFVICTGSGTTEDLAVEPTNYIFYGNGGVIGTYGLTTEQYGIINASSSKVIFYKNVKGKY